MTASLAATLGGASVAHASGQALSTAAVPSTRASVPGDVNIQPASMTPEQLNVALDKAQAAGVQVIAAGVNWQYLRPSADKTYWWVALDRLASQARTRKLILRFQLAGIPDWARDPNRPRAAQAHWLAPSSDRELRYWQQFVSDVAHRYRDVTKYFEIWNEPNISHFWYGKPDPRGYARLLMASYTPLRREAPKSKILFGGLSRNDLGYLQATYRSIASLDPNAARRGYYYDVLCVHPYSDNRSPAVFSPSNTKVEAFGTIDRNFTGYRMLKKFLVSKGETGKKLYIGEYGFSTTGAWGTAGVPDRQRADFMRQAYRIAAGDAYFEAFSWYCFIVTNVDPEGWAMLDIAMRPSLTYAALTEVLRNRS